MPLIYDEEFQKELDGLIAKCPGRRRVWFGTAIYSLVLFGWYVFLKYLGASDTGLIVGFIAVGTLSLVFAIGEFLRVFHLSLTVLTATVEWTGRKQLGEYRSPQFLHRNSLRRRKGEHRPCKRLDADHDHRPALARLWRPPVLLLLDTT